VKYFTDIRVFEMVMLGGQPGGGQSMDSPSPRRPRPPAPGGGGSPFESDDDDLPF
jgi:hypothetical protein